jgi:hypothetical protein
MNGTVTIGEYTVVRHGKRTTITGPQLTREMFRRLRDKADEALAAHSSKQTKQPLAEPEPPYLPDWEDVSSDRWGSRQQNQPLHRTYAGGNCLKACVASIIGCDIAKVPDPTLHEYAKSGPWFEAYNKRVRKATGHTLEELPKVCLPPQGNELYICGISMPDDPADHVVVARGRYVIHDPAGEFMGLIPWNRVIDGYRVRPTHRIVPVLSPHGSRRLVVPA